MPGSAIDAQKLNGRLAEIHATLTEAGSGTPDAPVDVDALVEKALGQVEKLQVHISIVGDLAA